MPRHLMLGGPFRRVVDPSWVDPLDPSYAQRTGGRWNPPGSFGVLYLCADLATARGNVTRLFAGYPYGPEDLEPDSAPELVDVDLPRERYVDALRAGGLRSLGLSERYPLDDDGVAIPHTGCQRIGDALYSDGELGIAVRSAAPGSAGGRELAWFAQPGRALPLATARHPFVSWYWR